MIFRHAIKNNIRNSKLSFLIIIVISILFFVFYKFMINIELDKEEINNIYESIPVNAYIEQRKSGYKAELIPIDIVDDLIDTGFIKTEKLETQYLAYVYRPYSNVSIVFEEDRVAIDGTNQAKIIGLTDIEKSIRFNQGINIDLAEGYSLNDFYTDKKICLMLKSEMEDNNLSYGDEITILGEFIREYYSGHSHENGEDCNHIHHDDNQKGITFTIVGSIQLPKGIRLDDIFNFQQVQYIVPARTLLNNIEDYFVHQEVPFEDYYLGRHDIVTKPLVYSAEFQLKNTKNLNELRKYLVENQLDENINTSNKFELIIDDHQLINSVKPLLSSLDFKESMMNLFFMLICIISFFLSLITTQRKIPYMAISMSLGASKLRVFAQILLENIILEGFSLVLVYGIMAFVEWDLYRLIPIKNISIYFLMYLFGCSLAVLIVVRKSIMEVLLEKE